MFDNDKLKSLKLVFLSMFYATVLYPANLLNIDIAK